MRIAIAQLRPVKGSIAANCAAHEHALDLALDLQAEALFFPELSLTGYEPTLAERLATDAYDPRLNTFQQRCDRHGVIIGVGLPTAYGPDVRISMVIMAPHTPRRTYSKQLLDADELPYFQPGTEQLLIESGSTRIAPAICYESLQPAHAEQACRLGATVYLASVAKSAHGVKKAYAHYPIIAKRHAMPVVLCNSIGPSDGFVAAGSSAIWSAKGILLAQLNDHEEGLLLLDTTTEEVTRRIMPRGL